MQPIVAVTILVLKTLGLLHYYFICNGVVAQQKRISPCAIRTHFAVQALFLAADL